MAADTVYDAIKAYLEEADSVTAITDPDTHVAPNFRWENEDFTIPASTVPWIGMALTGVMYGQKSIGASHQADNRWDETGHLWLPVFVGSGEGASRARRIAKSLADLFRGQTLLNGSLEFLDAFIGEGSPAAEDGNWYELPVVIEWRHVEA